MAYCVRSRVLRGVAVVGVAMAGLMCRSQAAPPDTRGPLHPEVPHLEIWSGGEGYAEVWSAYAGASWAPFGNVREDGFRVRLVLGTGGYDGGSVAFGDVLIGYHKQIGPVI